MLTASCFEYQMNRLIQVFPRAYPQERLKIIWDEVKDLDNSTFADIVSELIGTKRTPPLLEEFRDSKSKKRAYTAAVQKNQDTRDAKDAWNSTAGFVREKCEKIRQRLNGDINDDEWKKIIGN